MLATEYARQFRIDPQRTDESDDAFKSRVAGELRDMGEIVYAHQAYADELYNDSLDVQQGIAGGIAIEMLNANYHPAWPERAFINHVGDQLEMSPDRTTLAVLLELMGVKR